jgi:AI2M/AI1M-like HNH endonuclease/type II intron maturase
VTGNRRRMTNLGHRRVLSKDCGDRIHLLVPQDRLVRFNRSKRYGDLGRIKAWQRGYLIDSSMLEIVLAYNAEMRGLANYYRLAYCAKGSLRKLCFLWQKSLLKTLSFKLRLSVNQVANQLSTGNGLAVRFTVDGKERRVEVFNLKHLDRLPELGHAVDFWPSSDFTKARSDVLDRLHARTCEYCGATDQPCEIHHAHKLADMKDAPLWQQVAAARRRKRIVLCVPCHKALHAGTLKTTKGADVQVRRAG